MGWSPGFSRHVPAEAGTPTHEAPVGTVLLAEAEPVAVAHRVIVVEVGRLVVAHRVVLGLRVIAARVGGLVVVVGRVTRHHGRSGCGWPLGGRRHRRTETGLAVALRSGGVMVYQLAP